VRRRKVRRLFFLTMDDKSNNGGNAAFSTVNGRNAVDDVNVEDNNLDEYHDDTPEFIDMRDAIEVQVDDENMPMEDDDDDDNDGEDVNMVEPTTAVATSSTTAVEQQQDMSRFQMTTHTDAVYAIVAGFFQNHGQLAIISGGGDDKAYFHAIPAVSLSEATTITTPVTTTTAPTSQLLPYQHSDTVSSVAFNLRYVSTNKDGTRTTPPLAAVGSYDGTIVVYDIVETNQNNATTATTTMTTTSEINTCTITQRLTLEGPSDVEWLSFHPKGGTVLLAGSGDGTVWMFHIPLQKCLQVFVGHELAVTAGDFSPDGKWALTASADATLRIWAPKTGLNKHVFRFQTPAGLTCMATHGGSDGMLVVVGGEDGLAHVCHIGTKKEIATLSHFDPPPSGTIARTNHDDDDDIGGDEEDEMEYPMSVEAVGFAPSQPNWCATGGVDGKLKIWDLSRDGQCRQVCVPPEMDSVAAVPDGITRLQWHPLLPLVFTASNSGSVRLWDARNGSLLYTLTGGVEQINDMEVQFVPSSGLAIIVTASDDKTVRVFELDVNTLLPSSTMAGTL
jgi:angio-associated migratory cell protein